MTKEFKKFQKRQKNELFIIRTKFAYELIHNKNYEAAQLLKNKFERNSLSYPFEGTINTERELMNFASSLCVNNSDLKNSD